MEVEALGACSAVGLKEAAAKLPKEAKEYAEQLIGLMSDAKNKEKKPVEKPVEKAAEREKKGKKGKREEVEEKPAVTSFLEGVKLVTDFGGPLFKSYDRGGKGVAMRGRQAAETADACEEGGAAAEAGAGHHAECRGRGKEGSGGSCDGEEVLRAPVCA